MRRRVVLAALLTATLPSLAGCQALRFLGYFFAPRQIRKAEFTFPEKSRVLVMFDATRPEYSDPVFERACFDKAVEILRDKKVTATLVSPAKLTEFRRRNEDFDRWSIQRVGRECGVDYVLYAKITRLQVRSTPDNPVVEPLVEISAKLIAMEHPETDPRVWPTGAEGKDGRAIACQRQADLAGDRGGVDAAASKLGKDTAWYLTGAFYDVDEEEPTPTEP